MDHFLGLHYVDNIIENGMIRFSIIKPPFDEKNVAEINKKMLALSDERDVLKERWQNALSFPRRMDIVEEVEVAEENVPKTVFAEGFGGLLLAGFLFLLIYVLRLGEAIDPDSLLAKLAMVALAVYAIKQIPKTVLLFDREKRLYTFGNGIRKAMLKLNLLEDANCKVVVEKESVEYQTIYLSGGTSRDKALFTKCVNEFFGVIENQRYILVRSGKFKTGADFFAVPEVFGKRKEDALCFYECISSYVGKYELVYTRSEAGRPLLLEARMKAIANQERPKVRKRVKSF